MKRSPALTPLSHDHHHALEAALRLGRATSSDVAGAVARFEAFWQPRGRRHFEIEEQLLLPALPETQADWREAAARVRDEHHRIRTLAAAVSDHGPPTLQAANDLGELLHDHVRFEERHVFSLLESRLSDEALVELGEAIERAEGELD